jgi:hypothetical protein
VSRNVYCNICVPADIGLFGRKRDEVTEESRKLHYEEFHDLYSSPPVVRLIKSRRLI